MTKSIILPGYDDNLADFLGDLRSLVFPSQSKCAQLLQVSHTTISRYENGRFKPPVGYFALLLKLVGERTAVYPEQKQIHIKLLKQANQVLHYRYPEEPLFQNWEEIERCGQSYLSNQAIDQTIPDVQSKKEQSIQNWGEAPDVSVFYGREQELSLLKKWTLDEQCRLIMLLGMGGIGKTALVTKLAIDLQSEFNLVLWHSLRNAPNALALVEEITASFPKNADIKPANDFLTACTSLISQLTDQRILLILDNVESVMESNGTEQLRQGYEDYGTLLQSLARQQHQSTIILTSREKPALIGLLENETAFARCRSLEGLPLEACQALVQNNHLHGSTEEWQQFVYKYSGNPLALKLVAQSVAQVFGGDVGRFLAGETFIFDNIRLVLDAQFERLTPLAIELLYWLAIVRKPYSIEQLYESFYPRPPLAHLIDAVRSLQRRSFIEVSNGRFFLQNVILEYTTAHLINHFCLEIAAGNINLLQRHPLLQATAGDNVRQTQKRLLLDPLVQSLRRQLGQSGLQKKCLLIHQQLRSPNIDKNGYGAGNLLNLKLFCGFDVGGDDYSGLAVWQAYLRGHTLSNVNFSDADLSSSVFENSFSGVNTVALSPDGRLLAVATGTEIRLWHIANRQLFRVLQGHKNLVWSLAFTADGQSLFSSGQDKSIFRWDVTSGKCQLQIYCGTHRLWGMAVNAQGSLVATGGEDGAVYIWDGLNGEVKALFIGHEDVVRALAFSPDGRFLATAGHGTEIRLWTLANGHLQTILQGHTQQINSLAFTADNEYLISGSKDTTIRVWDVEQATAVAILEGHEQAVTAVQIVPHTNQLVSSSYDSTIRLWDFSNAQQLHLLRGHTQAVGSLSISGAGQLLASGSYDRSVRLWELHTNQLLDVISGKTFEVQSLAINAQQQLLASGSADYKVRVWSLTSGQITHTFTGHQRWVAAVALHPAGNQVASASYDRTIRLWDIKRGRLSRELNGHNYWVLDIAYNQTGQLLASGGGDNLVKIWDPATGEERHCLTGHTASVTCVQFDNKSKLLASGSQDGVINLWDVKSGTLCASFADHNGPINHIQFDEINHRLVSQTQENWLYSWDLQSGTLHQPAVPPQPGVKRLAQNSTAQIMLSANEIQKQSTLGTNTKTNRPDVSPDSAMILDVHGEIAAIGHLDGSIDVWHVNPLQIQQQLYTQRPYEGMNISGTSGLTIPQINMLKSLGARDN